MKIEKAKEKDIILPIKSDESTQFDLYEALIREKRWSEKELKDRTRVKRLIKEMHDKGCRPIVTVEPSYLNAIREQNKRLRVTKRENGIVTFGIPLEPHFPNQKAIQMEISPDDIAPVYDGPDHTFIGHVYISKGNKIKPEFLNEVTFEEAEMEAPQLKVVEKTREIAEEVIEGPEELTKKEVEPGTEMTWEVSGISFSLPIEDPKKIHKAFNETIPNLKTQLSSDLEAQKELERIIRIEYRKAIKDKMSDFEMRNIDFKTDRIFEAGDVRHAGYHQSGKKGRSESQSWL